MLKEILCWPSKGVLPAEHRSGAFSHLTLTRKWLGFSKKTIKILHDSAKNKYGKLEIKPFMATTDK